MPSLETTAAELHAIAASVDKAASDASATAAKAGEVAARAAASGFVGIAQGMHRVQSTVQEAVGLLRTVHSDCREAAGPVVAAAKETSPKETVAVLSAAMAKTEVIVNGLAGVVAKIDEALRMAVAILQGGQPGPLLGMLGEVKQLLVQTIGHTTEAKQHLTAAAAEVKQTGQFGHPGN